MDVAQALSCCRIRNWGSFSKKEWEMATDTFPHHQTLKAFIATEERITEQKKKCSYFLVLKSSKPRLVIYKIFRRMRYTIAKAS